MGHGQLVLGAIVIFGLGFVIGLHAGTIATLKVESTKWDLTRELSMVKKSASNITDQKPLMLLVGIMAVVITAVVIVRSFH